MTKPKLPPWALIALGILIFFVTRPGFSPFMGAAYDLTDVNTSTTYTCTTTLDCYNKVGITGTTVGPNALACVEGVCAYADCVDGDEKRVGCPGGSGIVVETCADGLWQPAPAATCPATHCAVDSDCIAAIDTDCDNELEAVSTSCVSYACSSSSAARCSEVELFWGQYKWWIISGILIAAGLGAVFFTLKR